MLQGRVREFRAKSETPESHGKRFYLHLWRSIADFCRASLDTRLVKDHE